MAAIAPWATAALSGRVLATAASPLDANDICYRLPKVPQPEFLPMSRAEMERLGWDTLDILLVSGDAYVDHPSFGSALLGRWLCAAGFRVGIVAQPRWDSPADIMKMGRPRLFVGVTAGALDSMLAHYTAFRKKRHDDAYTPGGAAGARPNRACIVYTSMVRHAFPGIPVVIGGIEASMRRISHFDFWADSIRRSILLDSKADLLVYGMAERAIVEIATRLDSIAHNTNAHPPTALHGIRGTAYVAGNPDMSASPHPGPLQEGEGIKLPSHEDILANPRLLMTATLAMEREAHNGLAWLVQMNQKRALVIAPPAAPLGSNELDELYSLPFTRLAHPSYSKVPPALEMIQFSVTSHRGCAGGCSFCALAIHQGRHISSRSADSILSEVTSLTKHPAWRGSLTNIGGATANMWNAACKGNQAKCQRPSCLWPHICAHFSPDQQSLADLMKSVSKLPGVKHLRTASGVRHDLALTDLSYLQSVVGEFTGGQLTVAPEHNSSRVLSLMRKPPFAEFERFLAAFDRISRQCGKEQYVIPYLISAFPGCTVEDMKELAAWLRQKNWKPQQVQCFIPTPGTVASAMYCAGIDPDGNPIRVAKTDAERLQQHGILCADERSHPRSNHHFLDSRKEKVQHSVAKPKRDLNRR